MSKRQEIRARRRRERLRNQILVIVFIIAGALLLVFALVLPTVKGLIARANATEIPVTTIVPRTFNIAVDGRSIGDPAAPVRLDIWEDFQCSACVGFESSIMPDVITDFVETGQTYYTYRFFPFIDDTSASGESDQAANASMCADEQGRFWDYHDILFANWEGENVGSFSNDKLVRFAEVLGLDMDTFNACFEADTYQAEIAADFSAGKAAGVNGTPSIFVNGQRVYNSLGEQYVPGYEDIAAAIQAALGGE